MIIHQKEFNKNASSQTKKTIAPIIQKQHKLNLFLDLIVKLPIFWIMHKLETKQKKEDKVFLNLKKK